MTKRTLVRKLKAKGYSDIKIVENDHQVRATYRGNDGEWRAHAVVATGAEAYDCLVKWA